MKKIVIIMLLLQSLTLSSMCYAAKDKKDLPRLFSSIETLEIIDINYF